MAPIKPHTNNPKILNDLRVYVLVRQLKRRPQVSRKNNQTPIINVTPEKAPLTNPKLNQDKFSPISSCLGTSLSTSNSPISTCHSAPGTSQDSPTFHETRVYPRLSSSEFSLEYDASDLTDWVADILEVQAHRQPTIANCTGNPLDSPTTTTQDCGYDSLDQYLASSDYNFN